ncbi:MAG TPA: alpha/beta fold hydrolase [Candidatus Acidoferrales bacterium]|nr:alpha/beta fold hydrolase [Candidatus Acidoferrales bacterium]
MKSSARILSSDSARTASPLVPLMRPAWLSATEWPFATGALEVDGSTLAVTDVGTGPALLFVHTGLWSFVWRDVIGRLSPDFRCVAFDAPGTGRSERLPRTEITLERAARAVTAVIEALDLQDLTLVFHDLGGPAAIAGASKVAERIRGLAAVNTFAWRPSGAMFSTMLALMGSAPMREFDAMTGLLAQVAGSSFGVGRHLDARSRAAFRAGIGRDGLRTFHQYMHDARRADSIYRQTGAALAGPFKSLPLITIFGERNDPLGFQPRWKQLYPELRQIVVPKGNHFPMCDAPDLVADSIREWHRERVDSAARG